MTIQLYGEPVRLSGSLLSSDRAVQVYVEGIWSKGVGASISNVQTQLNILANGQQLLPVTVNQAELGNSYVCSPYTSFVTYAKEELRHLRNKPLVFLFKSMIAMSAASFRRASINKVASINNWMLSTNLYSNHALENIPSLTIFLVENFPDHFITFRSLNSFSHTDALADFKKAGYRLLPTRQVYIYPAKDGDWPRTHNIRMDLKLLKTTHLSFAPPETICSRDYKRISDLYRYLYTDKYSQHNPSYTPEFIEICHRSKIMSFSGFRADDGRLCTVAGTFVVEDMMTAPIIGYDTALPQKLGLYRLAIALVVKSALEQKIDLHLSAGAASFKRLRGGKPYIEYSAVYHKHLPWRRRLTSAMLVIFMNLVFVPIMRVSKL